MNLEKIFYIHIREYSLDGDTGYWFPTKSGYAILADEVSSIIPLTNGGRIYNK